MLTNLRIRISKIKRIERIEKLFKTKNKSNRLLVNLKKDLNKFKKKKITITVAIKRLLTCLLIIIRDTYVMNMRVVINNKESLNNYKRLRYNYSI